jgi:Alternative oxidase
MTAASYYVGNKSESFRPMTCDVTDMAVKMIFFYNIIMLRLAISYPVLLSSAVLVDVVVAAAGVYALHYYWCYNTQQTVVSPSFSYDRKSIASTMARIHVSLIACLAMTAAGQYYASGFAPNSFTTKIHSSSRASSLSHLNMASVPTQDEEISATTTTTTTSKPATSDDLLPAAKPTTTATPQGMDQGIYTLNKVLIDSVYTMICLLYPVTGTDRDFARFYVLETVARVPYFAYLSVLHLRETFGERYPGMSERMRTHYAEADNELHHLLIMESLGGNRNVLDRWVAQSAAFVYYWYVIVIFAFHESAAYHLSELIEDHAYNTYDKVSGDIVDTLVCVYV